MTGQEPQLARKPRCGRAATPMCFACWRPPDVSPNGFTRVNALPRPFRKPPCPTRLDLGHGRTQTKCSWQSKVPPSPKHSKRYFCGLVRSPSATEEVYSWESRVSPPLSGSLYTPYTVSLREAQLGLATSGISWKARIPAKLSSSCATVGSVFAVLRSTPLRFIRLLGPMRSQPSRGAPDLAQALCIGSHSRVTCLACRRLRRRLTSRTVDDSYVPSDEMP